MSNENINEKININEVENVINDTSELSSKEKEKIKNLLKKHNLGAKKILVNAKKTQEFLDKVLMKMENVNCKPISYLFGDIRALIGLITDNITGKYTGTPYRSIVAMTGALIYFLSPIDIIPDFIPMLGFIDDIFVLGLVLKQFESDIEVYKAWKKPKEEIMIELKKENLKNNPKSLKEFENKSEESEPSEKIEDEENNK